MAASRLREVRLLPCVAEVLVGVLPLAPAAQAERFLLPPGYRMELVAADPDLVSPAVMEWDGNGRLYVSEFRSYMRDLDGTSQHDPINRISRWEDTDADGTYDRHTVFADRRRDVVSWSFSPIRQPRHQTGDRSGEWPATR